jgi:hypothetical protein
MDPGPDLPPVGRSLFDFVVARGEAPQYDVPFPFTALLQRIEARLAAPSDGESPLQRVLIPLGRSLQRAAARPAFFQFPRVVVAVDGESASPALLKDRLYLGYQEKSGIIEVISYNELAGRFEFQLVKDYRAGGAPRVVYAKRALCTACHQNQAPIFSRNTWQETNANPAIAVRLHAEQRDYYGVPIDAGIDVPFAIDSATDRANRLLVIQRLWRDGCGGETDEGRTCRAAALIAALQYRLSGGRNFDRTADSYRDFLAVVLRNLQARFPAGVAVSSPDLPNRNPLDRTSLGTRGLRSGDLGGAAAASDIDLIRQSNVAAAMDPLVPRPPLETWPISDADDGAPARLISGLGEFFSAAEIGALDAHLAQHRAAAVLTRTDHAPCRVWLTRRDGALQRLKAQCGATDTPGGMQLEARVLFDATGSASGTLTARVRGSDLGESRIASARVVRRDGEWSTTLRVVRMFSSLRVRGGDGAAVDVVEIRWREASDAGELSGTVAVSVTDDFAPIRGAVARMLDNDRAGRSDIFAAKPFRRATVLNALRPQVGIAPPASCCEVATALPPAESDAASTRTADFGADAPALTVFYKRCGVCHNTADRFPPNFLAGSVEHVTQNLTRCAERLFYRLSMGHLSVAERPKTPMPPPPLATAEQPADAEIDTLHRYAAALVAKQTGAASQPQDFHLRNYEELRECLPE